MRRHLPEIALFGALFLSLLNILAGGFGMGPALYWATDQPFPIFLTAPLAFLGMGFLVYSWLNTLMSNRAGLLLYLVNILVAPFGYALVGAPHSLGLALAIAPMPFYFGIKWISD